MAPSETDSQPPNDPMPLTLVDPHQVFNCLADGAYITDLNRKIIFWNRAAQRMTGWPSATVVGRSCSDNLLVHVDKDGTKLCGGDCCPLHRSIVTGRSSTEPMLLFAQNASGKRTPVEVTVAPLRNRQGEVIGGIETFRDLSSSMDDQWRARNIQRLAVQTALPEDDRVTFEARYNPKDLVGGDFYCIERLDANRYGLLIADAMGHGIAAALNTMQLRSLWNDHRNLLHSPLSFMEMINERLREVVGESGYFGTAIYATYNAAEGQLCCVTAGHPAPLLFRATGGTEAVGQPGPPLGMVHDEGFVESTVELCPGDALLLFTDGAT